MSPTTETPLPHVQCVDTRYLETLLGYNARRAALTVIDVFLERMAVYALRTVDFSVLSLISHNPGITSRQLCQTLGIHAPNLVALVVTLEKRGLIERQPHPLDGRAWGLHLTESGLALLRKAQDTVAQLEREVGTALSARERQTLIRLLQKIYKPTTDAPTQASLPDSATEF